MSVTWKLILCSLVVILMLVGCGVEATKMTAVIPAEEKDPPIKSTQTPIPTKTQTSLPASPSPTLTRTATPTLTSSPTATLQPGATQISTVDGMVLIYIPAGEFWMGSTEADPGADYDEFPQHRVTLDAYWIDQAVVTNAMYANFLDAMGNQVEGRATWLNAASEMVLLSNIDGKWQPKSGYDDFPVVEVTWYGAQAYCQWAGRRLPTEAEWEKAARGVDGRVYPWGEQADCEKAQFANCSGSLSQANSHPSGASPYGVLGMAGNVWEWINDWYADDYYAKMPSLNPTGPSEGETRVLRGGAWEYDRKHMRAANRRHNGPAVSMPDYGFRCVLDVTEK